jgi:hypothetical protein
LEREIAVIARDRKKQTLPLIARFNQCKVLRKHKVPPAYSPADESAGSLNGRRDDEDFGY